MIPGSALDRLIGRTPFPATASGAAVCCMSMSRMNVFYGLIGFPGASALFLLKLLLYMLFVLLGVYKQLFPYLLSLLWWRRTKGMRGPHLRPLWASNLRKGLTGPSSPSCQMQGPVCLFLLRLLLLRFFCIWLTCILLSPAAVSGDGFLTAGTAGTVPCVIAAGAPIFTGLWFVLVLLQHYVSCVRRRFKAAGWRNPRLKASWML